MRLVNAVYEHIKYESLVRRRYNLKADTIESFNQHPDRIQMVSLFTSA